MSSDLPARNRFNSIHRQQLFYWTGRNLDTREKNATPRGKMEVRREYVRRLKSLIELGLWLKVPDEPDQLQDGRLIKVTRPVACFTEWSVGQSGPHTSRYGHLGLGFSKNYILSKGGQPVIYVRDSETNAHYVKALLTIAGILKNETNSIPVNLRRQLLDNFDFVSHFVKAIQKPKVPKRKESRKKRIGFLSPKSEAGDAIDGRYEEALIEQEKEFKRKFGRFLHYLEEREWRLVYDSALKGNFAKGPGGSPGPDYYLRFEPGKELFTVVVPDNLTINLVMQDSDLRNRLFPQDGLPVTLLALEDVGTF